MDKKEKAKSICDFVGENLYLCLPDIEVSGQEFNSTLLFEVLSCLNNGKHMLFGEYGLGKTTSAEYISSLLGILPREVILSSEVRGHPEQTEEKMIARPDLGKLNSGIEEVLWSDFVLTPTKIIDELNRLPASKQNVILNGIETGNWSYLSELVQSGDFTLFATCNYEDSGNEALIEPVLDRFDIATESKRPGLMQLSIIKDIPCSMKKILDNKEIADKVFDVYRDKGLSFDEKQEALRGITADYQFSLEKKTGLSLLSRKEINDAKKEIYGIKFSEEAELFYTFVLSELVSCQNNGMKRANESCKQGCHYLDYACGKIENGASVRSALAVAKYARSLAWITGKDKVTVEEIEKVLPYTLWHKMNFSEGFVNGFNKDERSDPLKLYAAKNLIQEVKHRFTEQIPMLKNYVCMMRDKKCDAASDYAKDKNHMVFKELEKRSWVR